MLEDATHHLGPPMMQEATVYNVEKFFGWVSTTADFCGSFGSCRSEIFFPSRRPRPRSDEETMRMPFEPINPPQFPTPIAPYSAGAKAGNTVYVSGVLALGEGGVGAPCRRCRRADPARARRHQDHAGSRRRKSWRMSR
jgi:hypothetical protein